MSSDHSPQHNYESFFPSPRRRILVAMDATKDQLSSEALNWTLQSIARPGDALRLLGILHQVNNPMGYKCRVEPGMFGINDKKQQHEIEKIYHLNYEFFENLRLSCESKQLELSTDIIPGFPPRAVLLLDVNTFNPTWVVLDRFMKKERKYLCEQLRCKLAIMDKNGKGQVKCLVTEAPTCNVETSELFELPIPLDFPTAVKQNPNPASSTADALPRPGSSTQLNKLLQLDSTANSGNVCYSTRASLSFKSSSISEECFTCDMSRSKSFGLLDLRAAPSALEAAEPVPAVVTTVSSSQAPVSVHPLRASDMDILELLGGAGGLETTLFDGYVEDSGSLSRGMITSATEKNLNEETASVEKLDSYFGVDENQGLRPQTGGNPLCSLCNNKSPRFGTQPVAFPFRQIEEATNHFSNENLLAEGGFGYVFKGTLADGQLVAVKQHKLASRQGDREFRAEVEILSCAQHRNLVTLIGYCNEGGRRILVYEYVCNGSLNWHLSEKNPKPLNWPARQKIALGAARGLRYLHEECRIGCIVHRDVRPNNILLTHDFTALVGDFGLARWQERGDAAEQTRVIGTIGYVAPEYAETGHITEKADVYSFGLVLLEILTGFPAFDSYRQPGQQHLPDWASPLLEARAAHELLDQRIDESTVDEYELINMVTAASLCIQKDPSKRPKMSQVVRHLEGDDRESTPLSPVSVELPLPSTRPFSSRGVTVTKEKKPSHASEKPKSKSTLLPRRWTGSGKVSYDEML